MLYYNLLILLLIFIVSATKDSSHADKICDYLTRNNMTQVISRNAHVSYSNIYLKYGTAQEQIDRVTERISSDDSRGWNSGALTPQWIQYDLNNNQNQSISRIRLRVNQYPEFAESSHQILVGTCENDMTIVKEFNGCYHSGDWLSHTFDPPLENIRHVRIRTVKSGSWVAWLRILIDGKN
jgi:hypothetical protein